MSPNPLQERGERRSIWRVGPESTWTTVLPVAFIIVSLISLVILPLVVSNHRAKRRREITSVAEPARRAANGIRVGLSQELDKIIAYQVTGQHHFIDTYHSLVAKQEHDRARLSELAPQLNKDTDESLAKLIAATNAGHKRTE